MTINIILSIATIIVAVLMYLRSLKRKKNALIYLPIRISVKIIVGLIQILFLYVLPDSKYLICYPIGFYIMMLSAYPVFDENGVLFSHVFVSWKRVTKIYETSGMLGMLVIEKSDWLNFEIFKMFVKIKDEDVKQIKKLFKSFDQERGTGINI